MPDIKAARRHCFFRAEEPPDVSHGPGCRNLQCPGFAARQAALRPCKHWRRAAWNSGTYSSSGPTCRSLRSSRFASLRGGAADVGIGPCQLVSHPIADCTTSTLAGGPPPMQLRWPLVTRATSKVVHFFVSCHDGRTRMCESRRRREK